jgi:hypothetical protein
VRTPRSPADSSVRGARRKARQLHPETTGRGADPPPSRKVEVPKPDPVHADGHPFDCSRVEPSDALVIGSESATRTIASVLLQNLGHASQELRRRRNECHDAAVARHSALITRPDETRWGDFLWSQRVETLASNDLARAMPRIVTEVHVESLKRYSEDLVRTLSETQPQRANYCEFVLAAIRSYPDAVIESLKNTFEEHWLNQSLLREEATRLAKIFELEASIQPLGHRSRLEFEFAESRQRIRIGDHWHELTRRQTEMMAILCKARGQWVGGKFIGNAPHKMRQRMPNPVKAIIETDPANGYRIDPALFDRDPNP